jgi:hypothetical protein
MYWTLSAMSELFETFTTGMVRIRVRTQKETEPSRTFQVEPSLTIAELKSLIARAYRGSEDGLRLIFGTGALPDSNTVESSNITDDSIVMAYIRTFLPEPEPEPTEPAPEVAKTAVREIDDPSLPDWVRHPQEVTALGPCTAELERLVELGVNRRQARNLLRLAAGQLETAGTFLPYVQTEEQNSLIEQAMLRGSGASNMERTALLAEIARSANALHVEGITPADIGPFLASPTRDLGAGIRAKFAGKADGILRVVKVFREAREEEQFDQFVNPFAALGVREEEIETVFGERLAFAACLTNEACKWLLTKWGEGIDFENLCQILDAAEGNIETAETLLD